MKADRFIEASGIIQKTKLYTRFNEEEKFKAVNQLSTALDQAERTLEGIDFEYLKEDEPTSLEVQ